MAWTVETAKDAETTFALGLLDAVRERGFAVTSAIMDKGYDNGAIHDGCNARGVCPVTPLRKTPGVVGGDHKPRCCEHGDWTYAGTDYKRKVRNGAARPAKASRSRCGPRPTACAPLIPRHTDRSKALYSSRGAKSSASSDASSTNGRCCTCEFAESSVCAFTPTFTILAKLAPALAVARAA